MTTGLDDNVPDTDCTTPACLQYKAPAGTRWAYHNAPYTIIDEILQVATGQNLNTYINQKIKIPTGITGAYVPIGYNNVFVSKPRSMARFGLLMLNKGNWNGTPILTDTAYYNQMTRTSQPYNAAYGYLWWLNGKPSYMIPQTQLVLQGALVPHAPPDMISALGKDGQILNIVPSQNLIVVRMGNAPNTSPLPFTYTDSLWRRINAVICTTSTQQTYTDTPPVAIYPNPANNQIHISYPDTDFNIQLTDVTGKQVLLQKNNHDHAIVPTQNLHTGIYFAHITTKKTTVIKKITITQ